MGISTCYELKCVSKYQGEAFWWIPLMRFKHRAVTQTVLAFPLVTPNPCVMFPGPPGETAPLSGFQESAHTLAGVDIYLKVICMYLCLSWFSRGENTSSSSSDYRESLCPALSKSLPVNGHSCCSDASWSCANGWSSVNTFISCRVTAAAGEQKTSSGMNQIKEQMIHVHVHQTLRVCLTYLPLLERSLAGVHVSRESRVVRLFFSN